MRKALAGAVTVAVIASDLLTKWIVAAYIEPYATISVMPNFNLVHIYNRGVTFGILSSSSPYAPYVLSLLSACIVIILGRWILKSETRLEGIALASIIGGAVANVVDRLHDGAVTDFLDFYVGTYHWPAFNVADIAIVCGVAVLVLDGLFLRGRTQPSTEQQSKRPAAK